VLAQRVAMALDSHKVLAADAAAVHSDLLAVASAAAQVRSDASAAQCSHQHKHGDSDSSSGADSEADDVSSEVRCAAVMQVCWS
jgi:hypothetical protein